MARLLFVLTHSTDLPPRAAAALRLADEARVAGHDVAFWLQGEGVRLGVRGVAETLREGQPSAAERLERLTRAGTRLYVARACFEEREFEPDALREGAELGAAHELAALVDGGWIPLPT